jgi:O-methyltransferase involved in polyketide biosynthesis
MAFVAADFERHSLAEELAASTFDPAAPAFFSWLGVTPYLTDRAFMETMTFVASMASRSAIAFDYSVPRAILNPVEQMALDALTSRVAHAGEPFQLDFHPAELHERLQRLGFLHIEDLGRDAMNARYFANRLDRLRVKGNLAHLLLAAL